jgi:hypothetical protein
MLLRKQLSYRESFQVTMLFNPRKAGYESGLVVWWSEYSYAAIGVTVVEPSDGFEIRTIVCRQPTGKAGGITVRSITFVQFKLC